jgi:hypothetical protein
MPALVLRFEGREKEMSRKWLKAKMVTFRRYLRL